MERISIDQDKCMGCGFCVSQEPTIFSFNEEFKAKATLPSKKLSVEQRKKIMEVASLCPNNAIVLKQK